MQRAHAPLDIFLLGRFEVRRADQVIAASMWSRRKVRGLFEFLLLTPAKRAHKEQLLDLFWPDLDPAAANNNLNKSLYHLRRILCPAVGDARACPYIEFDGETVQLDTSLLRSIDASQFEQLADRAMHLTSEDPATIPQLQAALKIYQGDLLPEETYEDWTMRRREELRQLYLSLLRHLGDLHVARREYARGIAALQQLLESEPTDEPAHRALIRALAVSGQRHQALQQYQKCRNVLRKELDVEPLPETVALYEAVRNGEIAPEPTPMPMFPFAPPAFQLVGRTPELATLEKALELTNDGNARLGLVVGEAGIGKTRLAHEFARQASARGLPVLIGNTHEPIGTLGELPLPYGPVVDALRRFLSDQPVEVRQRLTGTWQSDLARVLPELGGQATSRNTDPDVAKKRLLEGMAHLFGAIASSRPLVLLLDDLHAADQATLELLGYLLHQPTPYPLFVLALVREESVRIGPPQNARTSLPLNDLLTRMQRRGLLTRVTLEKLTEGEMRQFVQDRLGSPVEEAVVAAVHETSEGNPLFAEQLLQAWQEQGVVVRSEDRWRLPAREQFPLPVGLKGIIGVRLAHLTPQCQRMLELASVIGREVPYPWLQLASTLDEPALLDVLDEALRMRILEENESGVGPLQYRFHHGLIRHTLYEGLSAARRRHLHQRVAEGLEKTVQVPVGTLSHHWSAVGRWHWAFCYSLSAANEALHAFAHAEAVSLFQRALVAAEQGWGPSNELLARVHKGRAQALMALNRSGDAVTDLTWLVERARASGDRAAEGQALSHLATAQFWAHNLDGARHYAQEALLRAQETSDAMTATMCNANLGCIALSTGHLEEGKHYMETVLARVREAGQPTQLVEAMACLPGAYHWQGDSARSLPILEEGLEIARREGIGFWLGSLLFFSGLAHGSLGHYETALDYFRQGARFSQMAGDMFTAMRVVNSMGWIHYELYDVENALNLDQQGIEMARSLPWPEPLANALVNVGSDYLLLGDLEQAESSFAQAASLLNRDVWMEWRWHTRLLVEQGWLALARGHLEEAERNAHQALKIAQGTTARKNEARAYHLLGEIALAAGDTASAILHEQSAVGLSESIENPRLLWLSWANIARAQDAQGNREEAMLARGHAIQVIERIAASLSDEELRGSFLNAHPVQELLRSASMTKSHA